MHDFLSKKKNINIILIAAIVFAIFSVISVSYIIYDKTTVKDNKSVAQCRAASVPSSLNPDNEIDPYSNCIALLASHGYVVSMPGKVDTPSEDEPEDEQVEYNPAEADSYDTEKELVAEYKLKPEERIKKIISQSQTGHEEICR